MAYLFVIIRRSKDAEYNKSTESVAHVATSADETQQSVNYDVVVIQTHNTHPLQESL